VKAAEAAISPRKTLTAGRGVDTIGSGRGVEELLCKYKGKVCYAISIIVVIMNIRTIVTIAISSIIIRGGG
jgi:hypothetical protein